jgi:Ice-binding-like
MNRRHVSLLATLGSVALLSLATTVPALAVALAPQLGLANGYAVLGSNSTPTTGEVTCTNDGPGAFINGNVGTTGAAITINGVCTITGSQDLSLPFIGPGAIADFHSAYSSIDVLNPTSGCSPMPTATGSVLPGCYYTSASYTPGNIILTLNGGPSDVWVFKIGDIPSTGALTLTDFTMSLGTSGALACNVYWRTAADATMTRSTVFGTILSGAAITETGGSLLGRALATTNVTLTDPQPLTLEACAPPNAIITVNKNFVPDNAATVPVALTCTSGLIIATPLNASEGTPAVFTVTGAALGATCTATEPTVPGGYLMNNTNCVNVPLDGSCTIINTRAGVDTFTVNKDFVPHNPATVAVNVTCTSGTVTTTPLNASEGAPAVFTVTNATGGTTCTATETVPAHYTANQTGCSSVALNGSCTITNTLIVGIPALSGWAMIGLAALLALLGLAAIRRFAA